LLALVAGLCATRRAFFKQRKLDFLLHGIDAIDQHAHTLSQTKNSATVLADDLARIFVIVVAVIDESVERNQAFNKQIGEFNEETKFSNADDQAIEIFADFILHEF